jgi:hypothetical protein
MLGVGALRILERMSLLGMRNGSMVAVVPPDRLEDRGDSPLLQEGILEDEPRREVVLVAALIFMIE